MSSDLVFIHDDVLSDVADAIRFVEGSSAGIAPEDYADHIKALDNRILQPNVLNFYMPNGGTVSLNKTGSPTVVELEYWLDDNGRWIIWQPDNNGNRSLVLSAGQRMYVRNTSKTQTGFSTSSSNYYTFAFTDIVEADGNTNSLLCKNVNNVTALSAYCYANLFDGCSSLTTAPKLPSTVLAPCCYQFMFYHCSSLIVSPELPATTLADYCYAYMFRYCTLLQEVHTQMTDISANNCIVEWLSYVSAQGDFYCPTSLTIPVGYSGIPSGWNRKNIQDTIPLNFTMPNGGTISLNKTGSPTVVELEYLLEGTHNWITWTETNNVRSLTLSAGQKVYIRNASETSTGFSVSGDDRYAFEFSDTVYAGGNINSLLCKIPNNAVCTDNCYNRLFRYCSQLVLTDTFILPFTTLTYGCYELMFYLCANVKVLYTNMTDISASSCLYLWLSGVAAQGDFYCPAELTIPEGAGGIPTGWTRHDI